VVSLETVREALPFRRYLPVCEGCAVRSACFGVRTHDVSLYGDRCASPVASPGASSSVTIARAQP
jgi:hypothetical protein